MNFTEKCEDVIYALYIRINHSSITGWLQYSQISALGLILTVPRLGVVTGKGFATALAVFAGSLSFFCFFLPGLEHFLILCYTILWYNIRMDFSVK